MRIHVNTLTRSQIGPAIVAERKAGRMPGVQVDVSEHRSNDMTRAFEVRLYAFDKAPGRRNANSGQYGATTHEDGWAATYDEWGWFLAALYRLDPDMRIGGAKNAIYRNAHHFHDQTGRTYDLGLAEMIDTYGDPYPYRTGRNTVGRRGFGRTDGQYNNGYAIPRSYVEQADRGVKGAWLTLDPRTAKWARDFASGLAR